jgi:hypothetical protein
MAKRKYPRKRTNANVPAKGILRGHADRLWSLAVRADWNNRCCVCGSTKVDAHHLVPRQHEATRYDLQNGLALCSTHHQWDKDLSPHQNSAGFLCWLRDHHSFRYEWLIENRRPVFTGTKNAPYYCDVIRRLKQYVEPEDYVSIVGVKFSVWLAEQEVDDEP